MKLTYEEISYQLVNIFNALDKIYDDTFGDENIRSEIAFIQNGVLSLHSLIKKLKKEKDLKEIREQCQNQNGTL